MIYEEMKRKNEHRFLVKKWNEERKVNFARANKSKKDINKFAIFLFGLLMGGIIELSILYFSTIYPNLKAIFSTGDKDVLLAQYSITFLLVSFLAFLSENNDIILWVNVKQYLLINPKYINFVSITIWAFCTLIWSTIALFINDSIGVWVFFAINVLLLIVLTLKMLTSYFEHDKLLKKIVKETFDKDGREYCFSKMYDNALVCIENKQVSVIYEMLDFLKDLRYKEFPDKVSKDKVYKQEEPNGLQNIKREYIKIVEACIEKLPDVVIRELYDTTSWSISDIWVGGTFEREQIHYRFWQALRKEHSSKAGMYYLMYHLKLHLYKIEVLFDCICKSISKDTDDWEKNKKVNLYRNDLLKDETEILGVYYDYDRMNIIWKKSDDPLRDTEEFITNSIKNDSFSHYLRNRMFLPKEVKEDLLAVVTSQQWILLYEMMEAIDITFVDEISRQIKKLNAFMEMQRGKVYVELHKGSGLGEKSKIQMEKELETYENIINALKKYDVQEHWNNVYMTQFGDLYEMAKQYNMPDIFIEKIWNGRIPQESVK